MAAPPQVTMTMDQMYAVARRGGFSPAGAVKAAMVGMAESSGRSWITSPNPDGGTNVGWLQIDTRGVGAGHTVEQLQDPLLNAQLAFKDSKDGTDWRHWATWPSPADKYAAQAQKAQQEDNNNANWLPTVIGGLIGPFGDLANLVIGNGGGGGGDQTSAFGSLLQLPDQVTNFFTALEKPVQALAWFINPTNWARVLSGGLGVLLLIAGLVTLGLAV